MGVSTAFFWNTLSLGIILGTALASRQDPRVIVYSFILATFARYLTVGWLCAKARSMDPGSRKNLYRFCSPPVPGQYFFPLVDSNTGKIQGLGAYFMVLGFAAFLSFVLMNVDSHGRIKTPESEWLIELAWSSFYAGIYWMKDLLGRNYTLDLSQSLENNLGYHESALALMAVSVLVGAPFVMYSQAHHLGPSGWVVCGPLLVLRYACDLHLDSKAGKGRA